MTLVFIAVMFGRVPEKDSYWTCHGSVSLRIVAPPLLHLLTLPAVM